MTQFKSVVVLNHPVDILVSFSSGEIPIYSLKEEPIGMAVLSSIIKGQVIADIKIDAHLKTPPCVSISCRRFSKED